MTAPRHRNDATMRYSPSRLAPAVLCLFFLIGIAGVFGCPASAQAQTSWSDLPAFDSLTSPAVGHLDGRVYVVGIADSGTVAFTSAAVPGGWTAWEIIGPAPSPTFNVAFYAEAHTPPVLVTDETALYLFARGNDNNLYETHKQGSSAWTNWQKLTSDSPVRGRISIAFTQPDKTFHAVYISENQTVQYRRFLASSNPWEQGPAEQWNNVAEGTIGSDGASQLVAVIRTNDRRLLVQRKVSPWVASWKEVGALFAGAQGNFYDISDVVYTGGAFHVAYAINHRVDDVSNTYTNEIQHMRIRPGESDTQSIRTVADYNPAVTDPDGKLVAIRHPLSSLIAYRHKLVLAYRDPMGFVRYARWDNADPVGPWIKGNAIPDATRRTDHRPALGTLNRRPFLAGPDYGAANFGNDLFAAVAQTGTDSLLVMNLSRAVLTMDVNAQFSVYNANSDHLPVICRSQSEPLAPSLIADISQDGRPFFTELGYILWTLPNWLVSGNYKTSAKLGCQAANPSGRFDPNPTCDDTKYPVIIISQSTDVICNGVWVNRAWEYNDNIFHELNHTLSGGMLGLSDNDSEPPTVANASRTGIPLSVLSNAFTLFGNRVNDDCFGGSGSNTCPNGRATGFTGEYGNYDVTTRQHSFIGTIRNYFTDGDQMRQWIHQDLQQGDTLLRDKYNWIKNNIFRGVEFRKDNEPLPERLAAPAGQETFFHSQTEAPGKSAIAGLAKPIGIGSLAEGGNLLSIELGTLEFVDPVDVYLVLYIPALDPFNVFLISDQGILPLAFGLTPLKANTSGPINMAVFGDIPAAWLPKTSYYLGLYVSAAGDFSKSYFWITSFTVP